MSNEFEIRKPKDLSKINSNHMGELLWWSYQLGTYPEKLLSIINKAGNSVEQVRRHLILT